jgi:uncharacterized membrane protein
MTGPAVVGWRMREPARLALAALAAGELVADKLPATPARTIPPALIFRALAGGFTGRGVALASGAGSSRGIVAGTAGAVASAYLGQVARAWVVRSSRLPDPVVALAEDALAISLAVVATADIERPAP